MVTTIKHFDPEEWEEPSGVIEDDGEEILIVSRDEDGTPFAGVPIREDVIICDANSPR